MASVSLNQLVKRYGKTVIVKKIDLEIQDGEFIVLVGPSGCGKSTILRMIAGLEKISDGTLSFGGTVVNDLSPKERKASMVFQNYALYPHMTVYENMAFGLKVSHEDPRKIDKYVREAADVLELDNLLERYPANLSGGQRQRVAMGRAIVRQPSVFLFDEPLSNLDAQLRTLMRLTIKKLHQRLETTMVYVTHDQVEAMTLADRIVILKEGNILQVGSPTDVYTHPQNTFVATFIGSPQMNLLPATVQRVGAVATLDAQGVEFIIPSHIKTPLAHGHQVFVGIRPNEIVIAEEGDGISDDYKFEGKIRFVEILGMKSILQLSVGDNNMEALVDGQFTQHEGQTLKFAFEPQHMHLFDIATEQAIP